MKISTRRSVAAVAITAVLVGGAGATAAMLHNDEPLVVSAAEGMAARANLPRVPGVGGLAQKPLSAASDAAESGAALDTAIPIECGPGGEPYVPTGEEVAEANVDVDRLAVQFDRFGVTYQHTADGFGFAFLEYEEYDAVASAIANSYWESRYPVEEPTQEELDLARQENEVIAAALDSAGLSYTRSTDDSGWETIEWDYEDPVAQVAVEAVLAELNPPQPPSAEDLVAIKAENDLLTSAFDDAGIPYTQVSDDLGWEWIEWDFEDEALDQRVSEVFDQLNPVPEGHCG